LTAEEAFSLEVASKLNEDVWSTLGTDMARDIKRRFKISGKGVDAVLEALSYNPWAFITKYSIQKEEDKAVVSILSCAPQAARRKRGQNEFLCKSMHLKFFANFAEEIGRKVRAECFFAPPNRRPRDLWCRWEFEQS